jgi:hypothetical protein
VAVGQDRSSGSSTTYRISTAYQGCCPSMGAAERHRLPGRFLKLVADPVVAIGLLPTGSNFVQPPSPAPVESQHQCRRNDLSGP